MDEIRVLGDCVVCGSQITDEEDIFVNEDGEYFCSIECVIEHYGVHRVEV